MLKPRLIVLISVILLAALTRLLPHPPNFTSVAAVALFGGAYFSDKRLAFVVPLAALFISDLVIGFYSGMWATYLAFALIVCMGLWLQSRRNVYAITGGAVASAVLFFAVSNFGVWVSTDMYPHTAQGLIACYIAAIPFFANTLLGDLFYTALLFGGFALLENRFTALREVRAA